MDRTTLEAVVGDWLPLPDVADRLGTDVGKVRRMLTDGRLVAVRLGERNVLGVPDRFLTRDGDGWAVLPALAGTLSVLRDGGFTDDEAVVWLCRPDDSLAGLVPGALAPVEVLAAGFTTEIRRRAQASAF